MARIIKIGIIGCGAIGSRLATEIDRKLCSVFRVVVLSDIEKGKALALADKLSSKPKVVSLSGLIKLCDLVIEAASAKFSLEITKKAIGAGKDILVMSVGGLLGEASIFEEARKIGAKIYIPSGALAGIDAVKAANIAGIKRITLSTYKSPESLQGAPYLLENNIDLSRIKKETIIFNGPAKEAVKGFPANVNVAAILSLVSGNSRLQVNIIVKPGYKFNMHKVEIEGNFGKVTAISENLPCPDNRKTSYLAVLSAIAVLKQISDPVKIGN